MFSTEPDIRTRLTQISIIMRRTQRQVAELNQKWLELVAERIELQHALDCFEIHRAENP